LIENLLPIANAASAFNVLWRCIFGIDTEYIINMLFLPGKRTDCHPIGQLQGTWNRINDRISIKMTREFILFSEYFSG
jgi:hypothetical protein